MKKIAALVFALCMTLLLSIPAFADGKGPAFTSYEIVCEKDTPYYRENWENDGAMEKIGVFPAGRTLTVNYEYETDGVLYGQINISKNEEEYEFAFVRLSDVKLKNETYRPKADEKLAYPRSVHVIAKGGVPLYAGPNEKYAIVTQIPRGAELTYAYGNDEEDYFRTWGYVTYHGQNGWINVHVNGKDNGLAELPDESEDPKIWVMEDGVQMYEGYSFGNIEDTLGDYVSDEERSELHAEPDRVITTLEEGKKYTYRYRKTFRYYGTWYYVTAGLRRGWVFVNSESSDVAVNRSKNSKDGFIAYTKFDLKMREEPSMESAGMTLHITRDTVFDPDFKLYTEDNVYYYGTVQGVSGWYADEEVRENSAYQLSETDFGHGYFNQIYNKKTAPIYNDPVTREKTVGKVPSGKQFDALYYGGYDLNEPDENGYDRKNFYYIRYNGVNGWIMENDVESSGAEGDAAVPETEPESEIELTLPEKTTNFLKQNETTEAETTEAGEISNGYTAHNGLSPRQIVFVCIGGAAVLALTAVVTLLLIRRRRKAQ